MGDNCTYPFTSLGDLSPGRECVINFPVSRGLWGGVCVSFILATLGCAKLFLDLVRKQHLRKRAPRLANLLATFFFLSIVGSLEVSAEYPGQRSIGLDPLTTVLYSLGFFASWQVLMGNQLATFQLHVNTIRVFPNANIVNLATSERRVRLSLRFQLFTSFIVAGSPIGMLETNLAFETRVWFGRAHFISAFFVHFFGSLFYYIELTRLISMIENARHPFDKTPPVGIADTASKLEAILLRLKRNRTSMLLQLLPSVVTDVCFAYFIQYATYVMSISWIIGGPALFRSAMGIRFDIKTRKPSSSTHLISRADSMPRHTVV